jgi:hypothetical protein
MLFCFVIPPAGAAETTAPPKSANDWGTERMRWLPKQNPEASCTHGGSGHPLPFVEKTATSATLLIRRHLKCYIGCDIPATCSTQGYRSRQNVPSGYFQPPLVRRRV